MSIELTDVRASFLWAETVDSFKNLSRRGGLTFLARPYEFVPFFEKAREKPARVNQELGLSLSPPWAKLKGGRFWRQYLGGESLQSLSGRTAWKLFMPLHAKVPFPITTSLDGAAVSFEAFFYPHGLALLATCAWNGSSGSSSQKLSLNQTVQEALKLRHDQVLTIEWEQGRKQGPISIAGIAGATLNRLKTYGWGEGGSSSSTAMDPFTLFTVVRGTGVDARAPVSAGFEIHQSLQAITNWSRSWKNDVLPPTVDQARVASPKQDGKPQQDGELPLLYGGKRGRAYWSPAAFTDPSAAEQLECYHNNLTFASLQTESLCGFVREISNKIGRQQTLWPEERVCAHNASELLGRLYGAAPSVYRSYSVRKQIDQNGFVGAINDVRSSFCGMKPLL